MATHQAIDDTARRGAESVYPYLDRTAEVGPEGVSWQTLSHRNEPRHSADVYNGVAGITLFLSD